jgi:hypothetical protein
VQRGRITPGIHLPRTTESTVIPTWGCDRGDSTEGGVSEHVHRSKRSVWGVGVSPLGALLRESRQSTLLWKDWRGPSMEGGGGSRASDFSPSHSKKQPTESVTEGSTPIFDESS